MGKIIILLCFCSIIVRSQTETYYTSEQLKSKTIDEIYTLIQGDFISSTEQKAWSSEKSFNDYGITITKDHQVLLYHKASDTAASYSFLYKLDLAIKNNDGYLEAETKMSNVNESKDVISGFQDLLKGLFYISSDNNKIMFGNDIEIDGGPATKWVRTIVPFK
jgi:hypothetical protein